MTLEGRILELAVKKLARDASVEELQELDDRLNDDPGAFEVLRVLLAQWTASEQVFKENVDRNFEKLMARIRSVESRQNT